MYRVGDIVRILLPKERDEDFPEDESWKAFHKTILKKHGKCWTHIEQVKRQQPNEDFYYLRLSSNTTWLVPSFLLSEKEGLKTFYTCDGLPKRKVRR